MFLDDLFVLKYFLLKIKVIAHMIALLFIWFLLIMLISINGLLINDLLHFFLNFIGELIPGEILLTPDNIIFTFAGMNHLSVTKILVSLLFIMNVGQVSRCLVLFATHQPASGLWECDFGKFELLFWL